MKNILHITGSLGGGINQVIDDIMSNINKYRHSMNILRRNDNIAPSLHTCRKLYLEIKAKMMQSDILHFHGAWLPFLILIRKKPKKPLVVTPHGAFSEASLQKSKSKKELVKYLYMRKAFSNADVLHALSHRDAKEIKKYGGDSWRNIPVAIIPNGINMNEEIIIDHKLKEKLLNMANGRKIFLSLSLAYINKKESSCL